MNERIKLFERDIIKTYRKELWGKFVKAIKAYKLVEAGDRIAVALSGGKDSLLLAKLFQELKRHPTVDFELEFISMDPGYNEENKSLHYQNAELLGVPMHMEQSNIFQILQHKAPEYPCYLCARMRRGFLYNLAQEKGCNKLALGHHFNDIIETTLLNVLYSGTTRTMLPKVTSENFKGMELIRPMALIKEKDIQRIMDKHHIRTMDCGCEVHACSTSDKRQRVKRLIAMLTEETPDLDMNIYRSMENIDLDGVIGWIKDNEKTIRYD